MKLAEKADVSRGLIQLAAKAYPKMFVACSFGKDSRVLVDLAMEVDPKMLFVGIDTGYEFPETLEFADSLVKELGMNFFWTKPTAEDAAKIDADYGNDFIKNGQSKCCEMKIPAIARVLPAYDAWITGLRRDETEFRKDTPLIDTTSKVVKINPIAFWTLQDVLDYIAEKKLRNHPLYDSGYKSLGCKPCTTMGLTHAGGGRQGQFERAGRFVGTDHAGGECGLHTKL